MKTFYYKLGHKMGDTMTVKELRDKIAEFPDDMPVFAAWEGIHCEIHPDGFDVETRFSGPDEEAIPCLVINADQKY